jgi:GNAT superfamily N-acetyltransferase
MQLREATTEDLVALLDLEREANLAGLAHVFPADRYPFPDDAVLSRWVLVLEEPGVTVLVQDADVGIDVLVAYDDRSLRHLAVHPDRWGQGLAGLAVGTAVQAMARRGATTAELWCLAENRRARRLYEHLGWTATTDQRSASWPPHPVELRYARPLAPSDGAVP